MKRILLSEANGYAEAALLYEGRTVEFVREGRGLRSGMILLGTVQEVSASLMAAFVNIGEKRQGFLPLDGKKLSAYKSGMELPVLVQKLPLGDKGAELSDVLELPGRFLVLSERTGIGVSSKISDPGERARLKKLAFSFPDADRLGYVLRTEAAGQPEELLKAEAAALYEKYSQIKHKAAISVVGTVLMEAPSACELWAEREKADEIVTDSKELYRTLKNRFPEEMLRYYQDERFTLFDFYKVSSQLTKALSPKMFLEGGGYIFIERTNALVAVDVNSAKGEGDTKEKTAFETNKKAAKLIFEQLRLRNLSGVIVIDFINMRDAQNQKELLDLVNELAESDPNSVRVYGYTALGLMELARRRRGQMLEEMLQNP